MPVRARVDLRGPVQITLNVPYGATVKGAPGAKVIYDPQPIPFEIEGAPGAKHGDLGAGGYGAPGSGYGDANAGGHGDMDAKYGAAGEVFGSPEAAAINSSILAYLAAQRESIFATIRGDNMGPVSIQRTAVPDFTVARVLYAAANLATDRYQRAQILLVAGLEGQFAREIAAGQQILLDAIAGGADWFFGDAAFLVARAQRDHAFSDAVLAYNAKLPPGWRGPRKSLPSWGV